MTTLPTTSRQTIRRDLARELGMEFYRRQDSLTASSDSTAALVKNSTLTQENDYWKNAWYFNTGSSDGDVGRLITASVGSDGSCTFESSLTTALVGGETFEILSRWSPNEVHGAINRSILGSFPFFFDTNMDENLILKEDTLEYSLADFDPWIITKVWLENNHNRTVGTATAGGATSLTDSTANFTGVTSSYKLSIYDGTGAGQLRSVSSLTGTTVINVSVAWTTNPDSTSKYCLWNPTEQRKDWVQITAIRLDRKENPTVLYLPMNAPALWGQRIRVQYLSVPTVLSADSDETIVPREYVLNKAMAHLCAMRINNNRADRSRYVELERDYSTKAEEVRKRQQFRMPDQTIWTEEDHYSAQALNNPLDWK